jgi:hypothetical protein
VRLVAERIAVVFSVLLLVHAPLPARGGTVIVNRCTDTGGDLLLGPPPPAPGSTLLVEAGTYPEPVTIQTNLTVNATGGTALIGQSLSTRKICQLTGENDLFASGQPVTVNQTQTCYGLSGVDLGASFEHNGRIYFLFGDTIPFPTDANTTDADGYRPVNSDSIAWIPANADPEQCLQAANPPASVCPPLHPPLTFLTAPDQKYLSPRVLQPGPTPIVPRSTFDVPAAGFSANGNLYAFFTTDHIGPDSPDPNYCTSEIMPRSVLARLDDESQNQFTYLYDISCRATYDGVHAEPCRAPNPDLCSFASGSAGHFINLSPVVVNNSDIPGLPDIATPQGKGLLLWGSGRYRCSDLYLAYVPLDSVEDKSRQMWRYAVVDGSGQLHWSGCEWDATPLLHEASPCIGEFSVTWNPYLRKWLVLYNCPRSLPPPGSVIYYRVTDQPWGPWSEPSVLFDPRCDRGFCHFLHHPVCDHGQDTLPAPDSDRWGDPYAPYVISSFTKGDATSTTIYWVMSTWNPYQVVLMKSTLQLDCACRAS